MSKLKVLIPFIVLYVDSDFSNPEGSLFEAEDADHAEQQFESENPTGDVVWIVQTDDINHAFEIYHEESTYEEN